MRSGQLHQNIKNKKKGYVHTDENVKEKKKRKRGLLTSVFFFFKLPIIIIYNI